MALLEVVIYPDERLRKPCTEITVFDDELKKLAADMFDTMYDDEGIGLAGPQVGVSKRIVVVDVPLDEEGTKTFKEALINPVITRQEEEVASKEGCLSVPDYTAEVPRFNQITVTYQDLDGNQKTIDAVGLHAICIQHELDHLEGKLFIDKLSMLKRQMLKKKYTKLKFQNKHSK